MRWERRIGARFRVGTPPAFGRRVMRRNEAGSIDNAGHAMEAPVQEAGAPFDAASGGDGGSSWDDEAALAALDAALAELEEENRAFAREVATPSNDVVEYGLTYDRMYREGAKRFICAEKLSRPAKSVVQSKKAAGNRVLSHDRNLGKLLHSGLARARFEMDWRRTG
jgi:hypothetical protein